MKIFLLGFVIGFLGAKAVLPGSGIAVLLSCAINGVCWGLTFIAIRFTAIKVALYFDRQRCRDHAKAETEGFQAAADGKPPEANPYLGEKSDHFRGMAQAWCRGYVRPKEGNPVTRE